jgi:hypothetical protein
MSLDRTTILKGPCKITYDSETFFSRGDVVVRFSTPMFDKVSAAFGRHGQGVEEKRIEVSFTPVTYTADQAAVLVPFASLAIGGAIYGATDKPMVITPVNGQPLTIANAAVTNPPGMRFSTIQSLWAGDVTFVGLCANDSDPNAAASYYTWGSAATGADISSGWVPADDIYLAYTGTYKTVDYEAKEGFAVEFDLQLEEFKPDNLGTVEMFLTSYIARLTFMPVGLTEAQAETLYSNFGTAFGANKTGGDFVIAGPDEDDLQFTLKNATPGPENERTYGTPESERIGELTFESQRTVSGAGLDPLFLFGTVPGA